MIIKQIAAFVENKIDSVSEITKILADNKINIRSTYIADTAEFGILRMIVSKPEAAAEVLSENGIAVKLSDVIVAEMPDCPGGMGKVLSILSSGGINLEYLYAFVGRNDAAYVIFKADNPQKAQELLTDAGIADQNALFENLGE